MLALFRFELAREVRKRSFYFLLLLTILPIIVALILRHGLDRSVEVEDLWAVIMGFKTTGSPGVLEMSSLSSWMWIIALLYGGDLLASDLSDGTARLILSRGVRRWEYVAAKVLTVTLLLTVIFALTGLVSVISSWILSGSAPAMGDVVEAVALGGFMSVGALPLLLLAAILGAMARKPVHGMVLGFVAYIVVSVMVTIYASFTILEELSSNPGPEMQAELTASILKATGYVPYLAGLSVSSMVYWAIRGDLIEDPLMVGYGVELQADPMATLYLASTLIGIAIHILLLVVLLNRMDL
ncbi:MAG: ABC transporter permease subunit [Desulfurococcales archaeon]|nr:ABC transporter permease subunit [Desulfurococcales archaeon]